MSLSIVLGERTTDDDGVRSVEGDTYFWKVGQTQPKIAVLAARCVIVEADGDEFHYLQKRFCNLPMPYGPKVRRVIWVGDDARFIVANLVDD